MRNRHMFPQFRTAQYNVSNGGRICFWGVLTHTGFSIATLIIFQAYWRYFPLRKINIPDAFSQVKQAYSPLIAGDIDDVQVKIALIDGPFDWHQHPDEDEAFFIIEGEMVMEMRTQNIVLKQGDLFVVPKGTEHRPNATAPCKVMLIEKASVLNTGDKTTDKTKKDIDYVA